MEFHLVYLDYKKAAILFGLCFLFAPFLGYLFRHSRGWQKLTFLVMCFLTISGFFGAAEWGLTIHPVLYRGTARGFHFYWAEVAAMVLIFARMMGEWKEFRFFPPGFWLYILYCAASAISILNAPVPMYGWFAAFKAVKMVVIFIAAYNFIRTEADVRFVLLSLGAVLLWQLVAVLNQKYVEKIYQVWGTFEHQNSLCMYAILAGMVFLGAALGPKDSRPNFFLAAYLACAVIVQSTLSRGGLAMFAAGTILVVAASLVDRLTKRRLTVLATLSCVAVIGLTMTMDTIIARFKDYGNEESRKTREMLNVASSLMLKDFPLGIGWNNYAVTINHPYTYSEHIDYWHKINGNTVDKKYKKGAEENLWWLLLAETGWQGFATYFAFVLLFLWWNFRNAFFFRKRYLGAVSIGLFAGSFMNYIQSILERVLTQPRNMMLWFILLGITARIVSWRRMELDRRERILEMKRRKAERKLLEYRQPAAA